VLQWVAGAMTTSGAPPDFTVTVSPEPHRGRARAILSTHPEIRRHFGRNPYSAIAIVGLVVAQLGIAAWSSDRPWILLVVVAYAIGAFLNHALLVMVHECAHHLVFRRPAANVAAGVLAGLPTVIVNSVTWSRYHLKHHARQGVYELDFDVPSRWEASFIGTSALRKAIWLVLFPLFNMQRAFRNTSEIEEFRPDGWVLLNVALQFGLAVTLIALWGPKALVYLLASTSFAIGLHPLGGRWLQEHFVTHGGQETYSYYGPLNRVAFNVGYHNEHHDFPGVAWSRLPAITDAAPEAYDQLASHRSWSRLVLTFLTNRECSLFRRVVRPRDCRSSAAETSAAP